MPNFMRLALGTLTRIPVPPPDNVNRRVATLAMSSAPAIGLILALLVGIPMLVLSALTGAADHAMRAAVIAALAVAALAWLTRAIHLDGLADTADALGSGRPADEALTIARRSDIGPFGVIALVLALLIQVASLSAAIVDGHGFLALAIALFGSRIAITIACMRGIPAARTDGLGATVASSVPPIVAVTWAVLLLPISAALGVAEGVPPLVPVVAAILGLVVALVVIGIARRRLGGITGDVIGATVEASATAMLVSFALLG